MEIEIRDWDWNVSGKVQLASSIFEAPLRKDIIARVIKWQTAKSRSGTHSTKTLSTVSGTTRKPWAQKGTGRARQGSLRSPQFRGGGVVFGPHPRDYEYKLNKKVRLLGCISSLTFKLKEGLFGVIKDYESPFNKTSAFSKWMKDRNFKSVLFILDDKIADEEFFKCIRNIPYCDVIPVRGLNVLDIVKHKNIICDVNALKAIEERFSNKNASSKNFANQDFSKNISEPIVAKLAKTVKAAKVLSDKIESVGIKKEVAEKISGKEITETKSAGPKIVVAKNVEVKDTKAKVSEKKVKAVTKNSIKDTISATKKTASKPIKKETSKKEGTKGTGK